MRTTRTPAEQTAIDAFVEFLDSRGTPTKVDNDIQDSPDCVLINCNGRIACECRYLGPEGLLQFHGRRMVQHKAYEIVLPWEPHIWISRAIEDKRDKIDRYIKNSGADSAVLLLHSSPLLPLLTHWSEQTLSLMQHGTRNVKHNFSNIWLVDSIQNNHAVVNLWDAQKDSFNPVDTIIIKEDYYPIYRTRLVKTVAQDDGNGGTLARINLKDVMEKVHLQPLDGRYRVTYEGDWQKIYARIKR